ncbi:MAG TPA: sigma-70 family RNA polymerase sigma factor [Bacteroidota bacterium]|nr:sigma-70 family RNA polymerase sigma factor [Bacteroidota bacterium]
MYQTPDERREQSRIEDKALIAAALAGEQDAFKRLMKKYHNAITHLVIRMVGSGDDVEDLTQEAFIKAFNSLASFNEEFAFSTWLYKIATNNCIDYLRKRKLRTISIDRPLQTSDGEQHYEIPDDSHLPDKPILQRQQTNTIQSAIEALPEKYRLVIVMRHQEEKSYEEIAEQLDLPLGTVKAHIFRAREMLYKQLRGKVGNY